MLEIKAIATIDTTGKYKTDAFNKSNALLLDLSFAKGNADRKKINVIIVTPTK